MTCLQWELGGLSCLAPQLSPPPAPLWEATPRHP